MHLARIITTIHAIINVCRVVPPNGVTFDHSSHSLDVMLHALLNDELIGNVVLLQQNSSCILTDTDLSDLAFLLDHLGNHDTLSEDVIPYKL